jgi:hypothetical protein
VPEPCYRSGSDVALEYAGQTFRFATADFRERVWVAARELGLPADERVVALATSGLADPSLDLTADAAETAAYWLRKLVFRAAWRDVRVEAGLIETTFDEHAGTFRHRYGGHDLPALAPPPHDRWQG